MAQSADLGFIENPLDRLHPLREDAAALAGLIARDDARAFVFAGDRPLLAGSSANGATALFAHDQAVRLAPDGEEVFLGLDGTRRPVLARRRAPIEDGEGWTGPEVGDLRALALSGALPAAEVGMMALAASMLGWHANHPHCSRCGAVSQMRIGGFRRDCAACGAQHFPRTDPVVIMLVHDGERALLGRSARFPAGMYSAIAGFVEPGETIEQAVARETREETAIAVGRVSYHSSQPWPFVSSLMIGCHATAASREIKVDPAELEDAIWVGRAELAQALRREGPIKVPPSIAIAHWLIRAYVSGEV
jgi:NAD+ diphosphatase